jgi:hypothetical protein
MDEVGTAAVVGGDHWGTPRRYGSWPCDNAPEGVSACRDRRDALQGDYFEHIFPISVWETTWFVIGPS